MSSEGGDEFELFRSKLENVYSSNDYCKTFMNSKDSGWFETCGDINEQCDIPDDFKMLPNNNSVDVMNFLGIQRAEPLRIEHDWD